MGLYSYWKGDSQNVIIDGFTGGLGVEQLKFENISPAALLSEFSRLNFLESHAIEVLMLRSSTK